MHFLDTPIQKYENIETIMTIFIIYMFSFIIISLSMVFFAIFESKKKKDDSFMNKLLYTSLFSFIFYYYVTIWKASKLFFTPYQYISPILKKNIAPYINDINNLFQYGFGSHLFALFFLVLFILGFIYFFFFKKVKHVFIVKYYIAVIFLTTIFIWIFSFFVYRFA